MTDDEVILKRCNTYPDDQRFPPIFNDCIRTWLQELPKKVENDDAITSPIPNENLQIMADMFPDIQLNGSRRPQTTTTTTQEPPTPTDEYVLYTTTGAATATSDDPQKYTLYTKKKVERDVQILTRDAIRLSLLKKQQQLVKQCLDLKKVLQQVKSGSEKKTVALQKKIEDLKKQNEILYTKNITMEDKLHELYTKRIEEREREREREFEDLGAAVEAQESIICRHEETIRELLQGNNDPQAIIHM